MTWQESGYLFINALFELSQSEEMRDYWAAMKPTDGRYGRVQAKHFVEFGYFANTAAVYTARHNASRLAKIEDVNGGVYVIEDKMSNHGGYRVLSAEHKQEFISWEMRDLKQQATAMHTDLRQRVQAYNARVMRSSTKGTRALNRIIRARVDLLGYTWDAIFDLGAELGKSEKDPEELRAELRQELASMGWRG